MLQVTEYFANITELLYAVKQLEKYNKGVCHIEEKHGFYALYRTDMIEKVESTIGE